jgi:3-oxoadipate enol-lactonase
MRNVFSGRDRIRALDVPTGQTCMPSIQINHTELYYESSGQGDPLLFIHGLGSSVRDWENQISYFAERYRVVVLDLRGHGKSDKPPGPYSSRLFADDITELIRSLDIAPVHVVGLSLGGFIACQLAVDHIDLVRSLVVVNSVPDLPRDTFRDRLRITWTLSLRRLIVRFLGMRTLGRFLGKKLFPRMDQKELRQTFIERWAENDRQAYLSSLATVSGWDLEDRLGSITCPMCLISGEHDFFPLALKEAYAKKMLDARLVVIPNSGHATPMDEPERFNAAVMKFLSKQG